jgi:hypothetical protein
MCDKPNPILELKRAHALSAYDSIRNNINPSDIDVVGSTPEKLLPIAVLGVVHQLKEMTKALKALQATSAAIGISLISIENILGKEKQP